ncbi:polyketide synthase dehydratase-domain-containing protein [Lasiosphaeria hispida]|uniref:Polyketide synthase dehydratase-domain-containing protein n=1 Tax=Lasiosphaeria hispida TaxID=260671 RepID=A0AAJ0HCM1_9PEZI|nr:polyketide synthase dehydratase-domain-containing protein [Lasiosphaeria hispida]
MVLEAVQALAGGRPIQAVEVHDFHVARSMFFEESGTETLFKLDIFQDDTETGVSAAFSCHANFESKLRRHAHGNVEIVFGDRNPSLLPERQPEIRGLVPIDADDFYSSLDDLGYGYSGLFRGITMLARKQDTASGRMLSSPCSGVTNRRLVPHPATMETLIQSILAAVGALRDGRLFALCVPTRIERIVFNPLVGERDGLGEIMTFEASTTMYAQGCIKGDVAMFDLGGKCAIQMEGVTIRPLEDPTPADDRLLFFELVWCPLGTESVVVDRPQFLELSSGRELVPNVGVQMDRSGGSSTGARRTSRRRLYIIRGTNPESSILARELETALSPFFEDVTVAQAFENLELQGSRLMLTTVSLIDMDGLYFGDLANTQSESLKRLLNSSRDCIWATSGEGIYHDSSFVRGLLESVALQNPRFRYQHLEIVENEEIEVKVLAAHLSRMVLSSLTDSNASESRPWTVEPALRLQDGKLWAPRISPSHQMNMRYMSDRRQIEEEIDCQALGVVVSDDGGLTKAARQRARMEKMVEVQAKYAISLPLRFERVGLLFLVLGTSLETSSSVIALARRRESIFTTRASWSWPVPSNIKGGRSEAAYLYSTASFLFAANIVSLMSHGETALIHEADDVLKFATITCATAAGIRVVFTQAGSGDIGGHSGRGENGDVITIALDRMSSKAAFAKAVPIETISIAANFGANSSAPAVSSAGDVWSRLVSVLRPTARRERLNSLRQSPSSAFSILCRNSRSSNRPGAVSLERARTQAALVCAKRELPAGMLIDVQSWAQQTDGFKIIDWAGSQRLRVQVQPASSLVRVSPGRTYLLGGMTDHLGRSISQWMISRGARNIILASRHPKIEDWWIEEMAMLGGRVSAMAMDLTEPKSVRKFERALRKDLSLLGGVVISADQSFSATALEDWPHAARRTVEGSKLMDSLFDGKSLDFFVMMLPLTETRGDSVRPVAVALSSFASTVVARRRERNLVGSILYHPGQSPSEDANFYRLSEQDLHEAVAEAILAGRPDSGCSPEIFAGLNKCVS